MPSTGWWVNGKKYMVSLLKTWYGDVATRDNQWGYEFLPKKVGIHSHIPMFIAMQGVVKGFFAMGSKPRCWRTERGLQARRDGQPGMDGGPRSLHDRDAEFWKAPDVPDPSQIRPRCSSSCRYGAGDGWAFTNTQRLLQWHDKGVDTPGTAAATLVHHHLAKD